MEDQLKLPTNLDGFGDAIGSHNKRHIQVPEIGDLLQEFTAGNAFRLKIKRQGIHGKITRFVFDLIERDLIKNQLRSHRKVFHLETSIQPSSESRVFGYEKAIRVDRPLVVLMGGIGIDRVAVLIHRLARCP